MTVEKKQPLGILTMPGQPVPTEMAFSATKRLSIIHIEGKPWFVAGQVCEALELQAKPAVIVQALDDDEKLMYKIHTSGQSGQRREMWIVNESGLYALIMRSNKPVAKTFRKWVTNVVLPAIRQTGQYNSGIKHPELAGPKRTTINTRRINVAQLADMLYDICQIGNHTLRRRLAEQVYNGTNVSRDFNPQTQGIYGTDR